MPSFPLSPLASTPPSALHFTSLTPTIPIYSLSLVSPQLGVPPIRCPNPDPSIPPPRLILPTLHLSRPSHPLVRTPPRPGLPNALLHPRGTSFPSRLRYANCRSSVLCRGVLGETEGGSGRRDDPTSRWRMESRGREGVGGEVLGDGREVGGSGTAVWGGVVHRES